MSQRMGLISTVAVMVVMASCGTPRRYGDSGAAPVGFNVQVERAFFSTMSNGQWRPSAGAGMGFSSGGSSGVGLGLGLGFSSTSVFILGGDGVGQANVFRQEVKWGDNAFAVPLTPGRTLHLAVQAQGGRVGWEALGTIAVPMGATPRVKIVLDANGGKIEVADAHGPVATSPTPAATASAPIVTPEIAPSQTP